MKAFQNMVPRGFRRSRRGDVRPMGGLMRLAPVLAGVGILLAALLSQTLQTSALTHEGVKVRLSAEAVDGGIALNWQPPMSQDITGYRVLRRYATDDAELAVLIENTGSTRTSFIDRTAQPGTEYVYRIQPVGPSGMGERSNYVRLKTQAAHATASLEGERLPSRLPPAANVPAQNFSLVRTVGTDTFATPPSAIEATSATFWVASETNSIIYGFARTSSGVDYNSSLDISLHSDNGKVNDLWTNETTMWVADSEDNNLYAYTISTKARDAAKDIPLHADNGDAAGIWSNGTTMWVADDTEHKLYAYQMSDNARDAIKDFDLNSSNTSPRGITSDGGTMWVADSSDAQAYAYGLIPIGELTYGQRDTTREIDFDAANGTPGGIVYESSFLYVPNADNTSPFTNNKAFAYDDLELLRIADLTVDGVSVPGFFNGFEEPQYGVDPGTAQVTVAATLITSDSTLSITSPADADTVAAGHQVDLSDGANAVTLRVINSEATTSTEITLGVNLGVSTPEGWAAQKDLDTLKYEGQRNANGMWSDGTTVWIVERSPSRIKAYRLSDGARDSSKDFNSFSGQDHANPRDIWSDETTMWVADYGSDQIYAYNMSSKARDASKDFGTLAATNDDPTGIWSDGTTMWVADESNAKIYAYSMSSKARDASKDFDTLSAATNNRPAVIWSNGTTMWVVDISDDKVYAYSMFSKAHHVNQDFDTLKAAANREPTGLWSDGTTMWVADDTDVKAYAYNMPSNAAPTAANGSVTTPPNTAYTFEESDFNFSDTDTGDELDKVKIVTLPVVGTFELDGATVTVNQEITGADIAGGDLVFTPATDATGTPYTTFMFKVSDGIAESSSTYTMTVNVVAPLSTDATLSALTVSPKDINGFASDRTSYEVGVASTVTQATVTATLNDSSATYEITPTDADAADGHQVNLSAGRTTVTIEVTAQDTTTKTYRVNINKGVTSNFGWKASSDLDGLIVVDNIDPRGIWGNSTTLWVSTPGRLYAFNTDGTRDSSKDFTTLGAAGNLGPAGIWSNGTYMWVVDSSADKIYAYNMSTKQHDATQDFNTLSGAGNNMPFGLWSDGETMWVSDFGSENKLYAYNIATKARDTDEEINAGSGANNKPYGIWSNGETMWVSIRATNRLQAYSMTTKARDSSKDFNTLTAAGNADPFGIWSDGETMWVVDNIDDKAYSYNVPKSTDSTLSAITVSPKEIIGFDADRESYEVGVASTVSQATVAATTNFSEAMVEITPADADVADGHQIDLTAGATTVTFVVTAQDDTTMKTYTVNINRGVTADYGWKASDDFDGLIAAGNTDPRGITSYGTTMWVADNDSDKIYAYNLSTKARDVSSDFTTLAAADNVDITGITTDGTTMWVADFRDNKIYAYNLSTKARDSSKDFDTLNAAGNSSPQGLWQDGMTMWVADSTTPKIYAYNLTTKAYDSSQDFNTLAGAMNDAPRSIWSDGATMWVTDQSDSKVFAYRISDKAHDSSREFNTLSAAGNGSPYGVWSDSATMWVTDITDDKIYSFNMPPSDDATLSALTVSPKDVIDFTSGRTSYEVGVASTVTQATVAATTNFSGAGLVITPADAVIGTDGHQVTLSAGKNAVTFTVTAEDSTEKVYTVNINQGVTDDYGWKADDDFDGLIASGNIDPTSISSDETTMWVTSYTERRIYAHRQSDGTHDAPRDIPLHSDNDQPTGTWSDGTTIWVADVIDRKLYAYNLADKSRQTGKELNLHSDNQVATDIYSDGTTMWASDSTEDHIFAYLLATGSRQPSKEFNLHSENDRPIGIWSNGTTMWVLDQEDDKIYAYSHSTKARAPAQDLNTLTAAGNDLPSYITGNSDTMWVVDQRDRKVYSYNLPISNDATLDELTVSPKDIIGFSPDRFVYNVGVASTVERATIHTSATNNYAVVSTLSTDRDPGTPGHQINLTESTNGVLFTVTAQDTATVKSYLVNINRGVSDPYGWKASDDLDGLIAADNEDPRGIAADTTTIWVVDHEDTNVYAYRKSNGTHDPSRDIPLHSDNQTPRGIWSNGTTLWVTDQNRTVYAYRISDKSRQSSNDFDVHSGNTAPSDIVSDGTTMWVTDNTAGKLFAYLLADGTRQETKDFELHDDNGVARGIWSNGTTMWVTDQNDDKIYAYSHATRGRTADADFNTLSAADNNSPTALTGDGNTMWVVDSSDDKVYSYNGAISSDATLSALTVSPKDIIGFDPGQASYQVGFASTVSRATVTATANHPLSSLEITPTDANSGTPGHQVNLSSGRNNVSIRVTAEDATEETYTVSINRGVTTPFGWKAADDLDGLHAVGNRTASGIWSNGTTSWVADGADDKLYAYNSNGTRDSDKDFDTLDAADNNEPYGLWSDGTTMWVLDDLDKKIYAYNMNSKARDSSKDFNTLDAAQNDNPLGIWSDGTTMWVADFQDAQIYAYRMSDKSRDTSKEFNTLRAANNTNARGIWSDGAIMWVVDGADDKIYAYRMFDKARVSSKEFNTLTAAGNANPRVLWSDGTTMLVTDPTGDKVYSYNHPVSNNADLKTLAVNGIEVSGFNPATTTYSMTVPDATREVTVRAEVLQFKAEITGITPPDADSRPGHQVTIDAAITPIVFTVTAQNGVTKRYTVNVNNDSLTEPPIITSASDGNVDENATPGQNVSTIRASDPEGATPLTFTIDAANAATFELVRSGGGTQAQLRTKVTFDYEATPSITVGFSVADPGGASTSDTLVVSVNNLDEAGSVTIDPEPAALESELTATIEDPDGSVTGASWTWYRGATSNGPWGAPISGASSDTYTPVTTDLGQYLRAVASYTDGQGSGKSAEGVSEEAVLEFSDQTGYCTRIDHDAGDCDLSKAGQLRTGRPSRGTIESGSDTDWFRFQMAADKIYRIDALAASTDDGNLLDPRLVGLYGIYQRSGSIYTYQADGLFNDPDDEMYAVWYDFADELRTYNGSSYNDDGGEGLNARMYIRGFPAGTHFIEVTTVPHQADPADEIGSYTLTLTELEDDSTSDRTVSLSAVTSGEIEYPGDTDTFVVSLAAGTEYFVQQLLTGYWNGSLLINPRVDNIHADPSVRVSTTYDRDTDADRFTTTTAGNYRITIAGYSRSHQRFATGTYTVQIVPVTTGLDSPLPNSPAVGEPTITGGTTVGETLTASTSGISDADGLEDATFAYQWLRDSGDGAVAITGQTGSTYTIVDTDLESQISIRVSFADDAGNEESVTSAEVYIQTPGPLYGVFTNVPPNHDGANTTFTFQMYFSVEPTLGFRDVRDAVLTVTRGSVTGSRRTNPQSDTPNIRWEITVQPSGESDVVVTLPPTTNCSLDSAVCTSDGRMLLNNPSITVPRQQQQIQNPQPPPPPPTNSAATGQPTISGTATVGSSLSVGTSAISDANGMTSASFAYQWLRSGSAISGATGSSYTVADADAGQTLKVRVSFTDDDGFSESVTSAGLSIPAPQNDDPPPEDNDPPPEDDDPPAACKYLHNHGDSPETLFSTTGCLTQDMIDYLHRQGYQTDPGVYESTWGPEAHNHVNGSATNGQGHSH